VRRPKELGTLVSVIFQTSVRISPTALGLSKFSASGPPWCHGTSLNDPSPAQLVDDVSAFSEARPWSVVWSGTEIGARVRKSRQKEAAGAADAVLMQIEWSEAEVLKLAGVGTEAEVEVFESVGRRIDGGKRWDTGREVGIRSGAGRRGAERGEPCRVFELWRSGFMSQL
jgi:hypothetical protein